jgi:hypothetical protein
VSIREVVGQRVRSLGTDTHRVLTLASVIGRDFELDVLEHVADVDDRQLVDLCDAAVAIQILRDRDRGDGYTFAHALIAHTLYDDLSGALRVCTAASTRSAITSSRHTSPSTPSCPIPWPGWKGSSAAGTVLSSPSAGRTACTPTSGAPPSSHSRRRPGRNCWPIAGKTTARARTMAERARRVASAGGYAGIERDAVTVLQRLA